MSEKETRSIEVRLEIDAPIEAVWKALTDTEEITRWFPLEAGENDDGTVWVSWGGEFKFVSRVEAQDPPNYIKTTEVTERPLPGGGTPIATEIFLETDAGKTKLRLVHSGFSADAVWDEMYDGTKRGWAFELRGLKHYLERHRDTTRRVAWVRHPMEIPLPEAWERLMGPGGMTATGEFEAPEEGDVFSVTTAAGDRWSGRVQIFAPPLDCSVVVTELNDAMLRFRLDEYAGQREVNFWLSTWGVDEEQLRAVEARWRDLLTTLLGRADG